MTNQTRNLPIDLKAAEQQLFQALTKALSDSRYNRISCNLKFEGLRIMPISFRISNFLDQNDISHHLVYSDVGASSLAKKEMPNLTSKIYSINEITRKNLPSDSLLVVISPKYFDYEEYEKMCLSYSGVILMVNGQLEEAAVGIGSVARARRKGFISSWKDIYWLEPIRNGALMHIYPNDWFLYKLVSKGYEYVNSFPNKPNNEQIVDNFL
tara:strand:- start:25 stop:657 length:633 start_codon:yes stop_codon:yes gene_type:complete